MTDGNQYEASSLPCSGRTFVALTVGWDRKASPPVVSASMQLSDTGTDWSKKPVQRTRFGNSFSYPYWTWYHVSRCTVFKFHQVFEADRVSLPALAFSYA